MTVRPVRDALAYAIALVRCPSVTPEEGGALAVLERALGEAGFEVARPVFSAPDTPDVENLFAAIGSGERHFCFAGHTDVVPAGEDSLWHHPPFSGMVENGRLYGRGAADMKGGIAAFLAAVLAFLDERGPAFGGRISLLITGDEEGPAINGTVKLLDWALGRGERFSAAIVGEPTNPERLGEAIKIGRRGSLSGRLVLGGRQGHVAYPHLCLNPVRALPVFLSCLMGEPLDDGSAAFQPSNLEVTAVETVNGAVNVIPGTVIARFNIRFNDRWTTPALIAEIERRCATAAQSVPPSASGEKVSWALEFSPGAEAFLTSDRSLVEPLSAAIEAVTGQVPQLSTTGGTSDARFITACCPVIEFGLVGQTMHQIDENIAVADLDTLVAIYRRFLDAYFPAAG